MTSFRPTTATINLAALAHNFHVLKAAVAPGVFFCPMVKANAYGHGDVMVAKKLRSEGAENLGVALIEEALRLRQHGDRGSILHFGMFDKTGADALLAHEITPVVSSRDGLETLIAAAKARRSLGKSAFDAVAFHLELNTGMNRLGLDVREVKAFVQRLGEVSGVIAGSEKLLKLAGVATHFSDGDDFGIEGGRTEAQLRLFRKAEKEILAGGIESFKIHVANSSAIRALGEILSDTNTPYADIGARPGIALYGAEPDTTNAAPLGLQPVMSFESAIVHVQDIRQGERVSYGGRWTAPRDSRIGIIPCGYADGYRRAINAFSETSKASKPAVLIRGRRVPVTGTICMDYFMCDLTEVQGSVSPGEKVTLIGSDQGESILATEVARWANTISYEIFTGISERVPRLYVDGTPLGNVASIL